MKFEEAEQKEIDQERIKKKRKKLASQMTPIQGLLYLGIMNLFDIVTNTLRRLFDVKKS